MAAETDSSSSFIGPVSPHHIFGLCAWAVSYAFFEVLARQSPFFISHNVDRIDLLAVGLGLGWLLPALIAAGSFAVGRLSTRAGLAVSHLVLIAAVSLAAMRLMQGWDIPLFLAVGLALAAALCADVLYLRVHNLRFALTVLAFIGIAYGPGFSWWMSRLLIPADSPPITITELPTARPSVIFIALDEMSTLALLDRDRKIDTAHFPNFARLASDGIWFRNGTAASDYTSNALIAVATGMYPERASNQPTYRAFPVNVCTVFHAAGYRVRARESVTHFCPDEINEFLPPRPGRLESLGQLFADIRYIVPHLYLPPAWAERYAPIQDRWRNFGSEDPDAAGHHRVESFEEFVDEITADPGVLYFNHFLFPHIPYEYTSTGARYTSALSTSHRLVGDRQLHFQEYMQQAMFVDRLLGRIIDKLDTLGAYDAFAIVIVADHGVSYRDGMDRRDIDPDDLGPAANDYLKVPMIIKPPEVFHGRIIDAPVLSVDLLPSLLDVIELKIAHEFDGTSAAQGETGRKSLRYFDNSDRIVEHSLDIMDSSYDVAGKFHEFDALRGFAPVTPYDELLEKPTSEIRIEDGRGSVERLLTQPSADALFEGRYLPAPSDSAAAWLAVARDGQIVAVAKTTLDSGSTYFAAMSPDGSTDYFDPQKHRIEVFEILGTPTEPSLRSLKLE